MAGRVAGKVAFITGAARGQGRSHADPAGAGGRGHHRRRPARPGGRVPYAMATPADLAETVKEVEALDRRIVATQADVRDFGAVKAALDDGVAQLGHLDIVSANAGHLQLRHAGRSSTRRLAGHDRRQPDRRLARGQGGHPAPARGGRRVDHPDQLDRRAQAIPNIGHYTSAKHGVVGLMRTLALELAPDMIRVNSVHPTTVDTDMIQNAATYELFAPDLPVDQRTKEVLGARFQELNALPIPWVEPVDISNAVLWLASDEARYVTGVTLPIDAGSLTK